MTNTKLMELMEKVSINQKQKKVIYILGGVVILSSSLLLYYISKNKQLMSFLDAEKHENERLNVELFDSNNTCTKQKQEIKKLESDIEQLQFLSQAKNKTS